MAAPQYDPFVRGPFAVQERSIDAFDAERNRLFPCQVWNPDVAAGPRRRPLIVFSHYSGGSRRSSTFLCTHLASHGYVVAALDHSEVVAEELQRREGETPLERLARIDAIIASRVPDIRFLLDILLGHGKQVNALPDIAIGEPIGLVGHSFGGWTVLATPDVDPRVGSLVAMAPGGGGQNRPGILPLRLSFDWGRDVPTLYLAAENDTPIPLADVRVLFDRTPASRRMFVLRRADHQHFVDEVEAEHEAMRTLPYPAEAAWIPAGMRPIRELSSGAQAHLFARGLALAHLDATLRQVEVAEQFLNGDIEAELAARGVDAFAIR
jgi:dienelactone hydrolase